MKKRKILSSVLSFALAAVIAAGSPTVGIKLAKEARLSDEPTVQAVSKDRGKKRFGRKEFGKNS